MQGQSTRQRRRAGALVEAVRAVHFAVVNGAREVKLLRDARHHPVVTAQIILTLKAAQPHKCRESGGMPARGCSAQACSPRQQRQRMSRARGGKYTWQSTTPTEEETDTCRSVAGLPAEPFRTKPAARVPMTSSALARKRQLSSPLDPPLHPAKSPHEGSARHTNRRPTHLSSWARYGV